MPRALAIDRSRLPGPGPARSFSLPAIDKSRLPNGLRVWTVRHPQIPIVSFILLLDRGASADPAGQDGLAALTADMLDEGSGDRSAIQMHEALALIGAQFDTDIGSDATVVSVTSLSRVAARALEIVADMVARPALREFDCARVRALRLHRLKQLKDSPSAIADRVFLKLLYGADPYGHSPIGSESTLAALSIDDVRAFHRRELTPGSATLICVGECEHAATLRLAEDVFGGWTSPQPAPAPSAPPRLDADVRLAIVPRAGAPQSELRIGHVAAARSTPDFHALSLGNAILGGQFVSRINLNLREDKGFTYGARTSFEFRRRRGPFVLQASVQSATTARAIEESLGEVADIRGPRPVTEDELSFGIAALTRGYARNFETADQLGRAVMQLALYDLPDDYYAQYVRRIEAVTREDVSRVMTAHLDPARLTTVVVGDPSLFAHELTRLGLGAPQILSPDAF